jgi:hypothetical protein
MTTVYVVHHKDHETLEDNDHEKIIGVYSTLERAEQAIERLRDKPGFREFPDWWWVERMVLNKDTYWTDGFVTVQPGEGD